jgi:predicted dehydrogenase
MNLLQTQQMARQIARQHPARPPRVGFLGTGWIGRNRLEAAVAAAACEVVAVADSQPEALRSAGQLVPGAARCQSLEELLAQDLDALVIATPSALHAEQAIRALEGGLAVFCQKPLARTAAEARRVVVHQGDLGRIHAVDLTFHNAYGPDKPWFYDPRLSGGGCVIDLGSHLVDLALWLLDDWQVRDVRARLHRQGERLTAPDAQVEDFAVAEWTCNAALVRLACSWGLPAGCDAVIDVSLYGTEGGASLRNVGGSFYDFRVERYESTRRVTLAAGPDAWQGRTICQWLERIRPGAKFDSSAWRLVDVAEVIDRIYGRQTQP